MPLDTNLLARIRNNDSNLTSLDLPRKQLTAISIKELCDALKINYTVRSLNLRCNQIGVNEIKELINVLQMNGTLNELYLDGNMIGDDSATALCEILNVSSLITLSLAGNKIRDAGAIAICKVLKTNYRLTRLRLSNNQISPAGARVFSEVLKVNRILAALELNEIDDEGAKEFGKALEQNTTLVEFKFAHNQIRDKSAINCINSLITRNQKYMLARRQDFIHDIILLAQNASNPNPEAFWANLPKDIRLHILIFLNPNEVAYIDKTAQQIDSFIKFVCNNTTECHALIKNKAKVKLIETRDTEGNYRFRFFQPHLQQAATVAEQPYVPSKRKAPSGAAGYPF